MSKSLSLTNSKDIICNSISLILGNDIINLQDLFLLRTEAIKDIIGLAPDDLNTLQELSASINNNSDFAETMNNLLKLKATIIYVDNELSKKSNISNVYNKLQITELLNLKSSKIDSYTITDINNMFYNKDVTDEKLNLKSNISNIFNKLQILEFLKLKSNKDESLTKIELENLYYNKNITDQKMLLKCDIVNFYDKLQIAELLKLSYSITESNNLFNNKNEIIELLKVKSNIIDIYNKTEIIELLKLKSDKNVSYSITQINNLFHNKEYLNEKLNLKSDLTYTNNTFYNKTYLNSVFNNQYNKLQVDNIFKTYYTKEEIILYYYNKQALDDLKLVSQSQLDENLLSYMTKNNINTELDKKSDVLTTYNKTETNAYVINKLDSYYNKTEMIDNFVNNSTLTNYYNKEEIDLIENKFYIKSLIDEKINLKFDKTSISSYYSKSNIDEILKSYNKSTNQTENYYNKNETDTLLNTKFDKSSIDSYYTKLENNSALNLKLDKTTIDDYFTKLENNSALNLKFDKTSISNYYSKSNINQMLLNFYNKQEVNDKNTIQYNNLIEQINLKATQSTTYSKSNIDEILKNYNNSTYLNNNYYDKVESNTLFNSKLDNSIIDDYFNKTQIINSLNLKLDKTIIDNYFTKVENNASLDLKLDKTTISSYYSKSNINQILLNYFNKEEVNNKDNTQFNILIDHINLKATQSTTYTKNEVNNFLSNYAEIDNYYTKQDVNAKKYVSFIDLASNLNYYYTKEILDKLLFMSSNILNLKSGSEGLQIIDSNNNVLIKASSANISFNKSINLTTSEFNTTFSIKNTTDQIASIYLGTSSILSQIFTGMNGFYILTHSNHPIIFSTNGGSDSMVIENWGGVSIKKDLYSNANTYVKDIFIQGNLNVKNINSDGTSLLKLKSGLATQILTADDSLIFEANDDSVTMLRSSKILTKEFNTNLTIENTTVGKDYSSLFLKANTVEGQLYVGAARLNISTNTNHGIIFATNRFAQSDSMKIESNGNVVIYKNFSNPSDSKLKNNQVLSDPNEIQDIFNNIDVYTYERKDLKNEKRCGFIAQHVKQAISKYENYRNIVNESTIKMKHDDEEEVDILTLDYSRLTTILWGALKNSNKIIDNLEKRLDALENR